MAFKDSFWQFVKKYNVRLKTEFPGWFRDKSSSLVTSIDVFLFINCNDQFNHKY